MSVDALGARVRRSLVATRFADVRWVEETGSTNADILELARRGEPEGIVVVADHQTAGRGRMGRTWTAPPGSSLLLTILLRPPAPVAGAVPMAVAVAAVDAITAVTGSAPRLKWPNDLVWPGDGSETDRKLAGILTEAEWPAGSHIAGGWTPPGRRDRVTLAVGIGINVTWPDPIPDELAGAATALDHLTGAPVAREEVLVALLAGLDGAYGALARTLDNEPVRNAWRARSATLGRRVRIDLGTEDVEGTAVDITDEGHLVVDGLDGERRVFAIGDVVHLRPV